MRTEIFQALTGHAGLTAIVGGRIYQASNLFNVPKKPFVVFRMHNAYVFQLGHRKMVQVWYHDEPGDYSRIDQMMEHGKAALEAIPPHDNFLELRWFEDSVDLKDDDMGTICRNARYQMTLV